MTLLTPWPSTHNDPCHRTGHRLAVDLGSGPVHSMRPPIACRVCSNTWAMGEAMKVRIKKFDVEMEVGNSGTDLEAAAPFQLAR